MGKDTAIGWCDATFNPWWGCTRVSPGCERCYAETFAKRVGQDIWGPTKGRRFFGEKHWNEPIHWDAKARREGRRLKVFCASMADICEDHEQLEPWRTRLIELVKHTRNIDWLFLTKRPENYLKMFGDGFFRSNPHVWPGFTAENQEQLDKRVGHVVRIPGKGRKWISAEPLLSRLDVRSHLRRTEHVRENGSVGKIIARHIDGIVWVVVGGESGCEFRDPGVEHLISVVDQCKATVVACYVKQDAGRLPGQQGRIPDEYWSVKEFPR